MKQGGQRHALTYITDLLSSQLRYYYLSTSKILSALRDNEYLRASKIFTTRVREEFSQRAVLPHSQLLVLKVSSSGGGSKKTEEPRKHYDLGKV